MQRETALDSFHKSVARPAGPHSPPFQIAGECLDAHEAVADGRQRYAIFAFLPAPTAIPMQITQPMILRVFRQGLDMGRSYDAFRSSYDDFRNALPDFPCIGVCAFDLLNGAGNSFVRKLLMVYWMPDSGAFDNHSIDFIKRTLAEVRGIDEEIRTRWRLETAYPVVLDRLRLR